jgi:hypothetical protein
MKFNHDQASDIHPQASHSGNNEFHLLGYSAVQSDESQPMLGSACYLLHARFLALKMDTVCSFEMSVDFHQTTWCYIPENRILHP